MKIIGKCLNKEEFKKYVDDKFFGFLPANKLILHHTHRPTIKQWKGKETINNLKRFYEGKGWKAGPHLFIAPDGIWLFSDMRKNGIHAGPGNHRSVGIEMVGNYQEKRPEGTVLNYVLYAITVLNNKLKLKSEDIKFHRDFMATACPGNAVRKWWIVDKIKNYRILPDNSLIQEKTKKAVFFIKNNVKYPIPDWVTFLFYWEDRQKDILLLSKGEINQIKIGKTLPSIKKLIKNL